MPTVYYKVKNNKPEVHQFDLAAQIGEEIRCYRSMGEDWADLVAERLSALLDEVVFTQSTNVQDFRSRSEILQYA